MYDDRKSFAPVQVGEEIDVRIEAVGEKGDGIARKKGFVLFIPNAKEGAEVRVKVTKVLRKVGFAEMLGPAQGKPEEDAAPASQSREEAPAVQPVPAAPAPTDSEDFGEDTSAYQPKVAEEAPAEEPVEEETPEMDIPPAPEPVAEEEEKKEE